MAGSRSEYYEKLDVPAFLDRPEVAQYVGDNFEHYKKTWLADYEAAGKNASGILWRPHLNWAAMVLWPIWFGYRGLIGYLAVFTVLFILVDWVAQVGIIQAGWTKTQVQVGIAILCLLLAIFSKGIYFRHVADFFHENASLPPEALAAKVAAKGDVSKKRAFIAIAVFTVVALVCNVLGNMIITRF